VPAQLTTAQLRETALRLTGGRRRSWRRWPNAGPRPRRPWLRRAELTRRSPCTARPAAGATPSGGQTDVTPASHLTAMPFDAGHPWRDGNLGMPPRWTSGVRVYLGWPPHGPSEVRIYLGWLPRGPSGVRIYLGWPPHGPSGVRITADCLLCAGHSARNWSLQLSRSALQTVSVGSDRVAKAAGRPDIDSLREEGCRWLLEHERHVELGEAAEAAGDAEAAAKHYLRGGSPGFAADVTALQHAASKHSFLAPHTAASV
jgi:hypothetical protein